MLAVATITVISSLLPPLYLLPYILALFENGDLYFLSNE